jgi:hypothetical protein
MAWRILALAALLSCSACCMDRRPHASPATSPGPQETDLEPGAVDPREDPGARGTGREPDPGAVSACDRYLLCCIAYMDALAALPGSDPAALEQGKESCHALEGLAGTTGAEGACQSALDAFAMGFEEVVKSVPGFDVPPECR